MSDQPSRISDAKPQRAPRRPGAKRIKFAVPPGLTGQPRPSRLLRLEQELQEAKARLDAMTRLAYLDEMSGLANRRAFDDELRRTIDRATRYAMPAVVAIFDIDQFKAINDRYGHRAGDAVIVAVAQCLRTHVRASDFVARTGGDEFAVILSNIDLEDAGQKVEALRQAFGRIEYHFAAEPVHVSVSAGLSAIEAGFGQCPLHEADLAMYRQKRASRTIYTLG
jgi:diguanylate cyclase (GGDEF)-like protein